MNMTGRFKCPECKGEGFVWVHGKYNTERIWTDEWCVSVCATCESHRFVLTNESGTIVGPDAPPQYLCKHKEVLTKCSKCSPL